MKCIKIGDSVNLVGKNIDLKDVLARLGHGPLLAVNLGSLHSEGPALLAAAERQQLLPATDEANGELAARILALKFSDISFVGQLR